jgi:hypothetical protein
MIRNGAKQSNAPATTVAVLISSIVGEVCYASADARRREQAALDSKFGK